MNIYINNEKLDFTLEKEKTAAEVIRAIDGWLSENGSGVITVDIDGTHIDDIEHIETNNLETISTIHITAGRMAPTDSAGVCREFETHKKHLSAFSQNIEQTVSSLQTGHDASAMNDIIEMSDLLNNIVILFESARIMKKLDFTSIEHNGTSLETFRNDFNTLLKEFSNAVEHKDIVQLCDLLEYEIKPHIALLQDFIDVIIQHMK